MAVTNRSQCTHTCCKAHQHPAFAYCAASLHRMRPVLLNEDGEQIGTMAELDMSSGNSLSTAGEVWSTCLHFNGNYTDNKGKQQTLKLSHTYGLKVQMFGPLAAADVALGIKYPMSEVRRTLSVSGTATSCLFKAAARQSNLHAKASSGYPDCSD